MVTKVCTGHKSGSEAAVHAMNSLFQHEVADAVLLVDASNTFNTINRAASLINMVVGQAKDGQTGYWILS